jgi:hypothetical protein
MAMAAIRSEPSSQNSNFSKNAAKAWRKGKGSNEAS